MFINNVKELNGCLREEVPCKFLIGSFSIKPYFISCSRGNECGRGYCCYHLDDDSRDEQVKEIQELVKEE